MREVGEKVKNLRKGDIYEKKCEEYEKFEKSAKIEIFEKSERIMRYVDKVIYAKKLQEVLELQQKFICVRKSEIFVQNVKKWYVWENVRVVLEKVRSIKIIEMCKKKWEKEGMREM